MDISVTDFVEFIAKAGPPKLTHVRNIKNRPKYDPRTDYWKGLRDAISEFHEGGSKEPAILDKAIMKHRTGHQGSLYESRMTAYRRFLRRKAIQWREPVRGSWHFEDLHVRVNPELHMVIDGTPHVLKLFLRSEGLSKKNADVLNYMMAACLSAKVEEGTRFCVFDVAKAKLAYVREDGVDLKPLLRGEARSFIEIWNSTD